MAPRSNDGRRNDLAVEETRPGETDTAGRVTQDNGNNDVFRDTVDVQCSKQHCEMELLEDAGPLGAPARDRQVPTERRRDTKKSKIYDKGLEKEKKLVILDVESDDEHEEWPEITLDKHEEEIHGRDEEPSCSGGKNGLTSLDKDIDDPAMTEDHGELFLKHKVRQKDTLAGLAVKYNVSISDIKRANGFQTDSALYGKEWVIIPRKPFPIGPEHAAWAGMILAHYEQGISLPLPHGTNIRDYYSGNTSPVRARDPGDEDSVLLGSGHLLSSRQKEVEMMSRSGYRNDKLRRRRIEEDHEPRRLDVDENDPATRQFFDAMRERDTTPLFSPATTARFNSWREKSVSTLSTGAMRELKDLHSKSIKWRDQLFSKIKKATSQPTMTTTSSLKKD